MIIRFLVLLIIFNSILFTGFINAGNDTNFLTSSALKVISLIPQTWESYLGGVDLGHNQIINMWMQPLLITLSLIARLGLSFSVIVKIIIAFELIIGIIGLDKFLKRLGMSQIAITVATLFYFSNTYFLTLIDGGLIFVAGVYAMFPLLLYFGYETLTNLRLENIAKLSLLLIICQSFDIRVVPLFFVCLVLINLKRSVAVIPLLSVILIGWNMFWIWPAIKSHIPINFSYTNFSQLSQFSFATTGHLLAFSQPHWFNNLFGDVQPVRWYLWLIPAIAVVSFFAKKQSKLFIALTLIGLFLSKGSLPPFGQIYEWLYKSIPGFAVFRDPSKFLILVSIGYAGLIAQAVGSKKIISIVLSLYFLLVASPAFLGKMSGSFSPQPLQKDYEKLTGLLEADSGFGRLLWLPAKPPLGPVSDKKIWTESQSLLNKFPFLNLVDGSYEVLNYLRAPAASQLLDVSGVEYLVYPYPDERKKVLKPDEKEYYYWYREWFAKSTWLKDLSWSDKLAVFQTSSHAPRLYQIDNVKWVVGSHNTYENISSSSATLRSQIIIHLENGVSFQPQTGDGVIFNNANTLDLIMSQLPQKHLIPAKQLITSLSWWHRDSGDFLFIRNYLFDRYKVRFSDVDLSLGYSIAEGRQESNEISLDKSGDLYVRLLLSEAGDKIQILGQDISTQSKRNNFAWINIGQYTAGTKFKVIANGQINVINAFAVMPSDELSMISAQVLNELNQLKPRPSTSDLIPVSYIQESPTAYKLQVQEPGKWLVFSESFDAQWELINSKTGEILTPLPAYDMLNGYYISNTGEYILRYKPQRFVLPGSLISLITLASLLGVWLGSKYAKK